MDIGLVVGPWGVTFEEAVASMRATEKHGFSSYYLGDHFYTVNQIDSLEPYLLFALAARETERIRFGSLVTPVMFRPPSNVGRLAAQLDLLSGGRFVLGLGVGWNEGEHLAYGIDYPSLGELFDRLEEYLQVLWAMWGEGPASFEGRYYQLREAQVLPKPAPFHPTVLVAGGGEKRTLPLVAKYAHEWNAVDLPLDAYRHKCEVLAGSCEEIGRDPGQIRHTMTTMGLIGSTDAEVEAATLLQMERMPPPPGMSPADYREMLRGIGAIMGTADEIVDKLGRLAEAGVDEVQFTYFDLSSDSVPAWLASEVLPQVADL
ncbi:MAG: TIGR03560 family F420-dependent LLM class oxidoreductase [Dehalococcoidia bacterium]|nr:TIGR03560 family F420-dependent LLM class oxidoreductase [Dehalococcoidia bacterium]MYA54067.1 TIGR03560 family F420-dependent LLM class oxidoreductase [Dehalococcoidia bacterium]